MFRKYFAGRSYLWDTRENQTVMTLRILVMCSTRNLLRGIASRESSHEIHLVFNKSLSLHTLSHTQPLQ